MGSREGVIVGDDDAAGEGVEGFENVVGFCHSAGCEKDCFVFVGSERVFSAGWFFGGWGSWGEWREVEEGGEDESEVPEEGYEEVEEVVES